MARRPFDAARFRGLTERMFAQCTQADLEDPPPDGDYWVIAQAATWPRGRSADSVAEQLIDDGGRKEQPRQLPREQSAQPPTPSR